MERFAFLPLSEAQRGIKGLVQPKMKVEKVDRVAEGKKAHRYRKRKEELVVFHRYLLAIHSEMTKFQRGHRPTSSSHISPF